MANFIPMISLKVQQKMNRTKELELDHYHLELYHNITFPLDLMFNPLNPNAD